MNSSQIAMLCVLILPLIALSTADNTSTSKPSDNKVSKMQFNAIKRQTSFLFLALLSSVLDLLSKPTLDCFCLGLNHSWNYCGFNHPSGEHKNG